MNVSPLEIVLFTAITLVAWLLLRRSMISAATASPRLRESKIKLLPVTSPTALAGRNSTSATGMNSAAVASDSPVQKFDNWFHRVVSLAQSHWNTSQATWLIVGLAAVVAVATFVFTESVRSTLFAAVSAVVVGVLGFSFAFRHTVRKFQSQLPQAMQLMARAVRAGESLEQAVHLVSDAADDPLKTEFRRCLKQVEMGLPVRSAMASLSDRMDTLDTRIFGSTISVHRESGGGLADTLDRLAGVIRNRYEYHQKLRSSTGAGRVSVIIIAFLGLLIFSYMFLFRPDYGREMWVDPAGQSMLVFAVISELIGLLWVYSLLRAEY